MRCTHSLTSCRRQRFYNRFSIGKNCMCHELGLRKRRTSPGKTYSSYTSCPSRQRSSRLAVTSARTHLTVSCEPALVRKFPNLEPLFPQKGTLTTYSACLTNASDNRVRPLVSSPGVARVVSGGSYASVAPALGSLLQEIGRALCRGVAKKELASGPPIVGVLISSAQGPVQRRPREWGGNLEKV